MKERTDSQKSGKNPTSILRKILKWISWFAVFVIVLFVVVVLAIRTPVVQQWITNKATDYVTEQTGAEFSIDRLYLTFSGNLWLEGVYMSDLEGDTLFFSSSLEAGFRIRPLFNREIKLRKFDWNGIVAIISTDSTGRNNYDFLIDAFASEPTIEVETGPGTPFQIFLPDIRISELFFSMNDRFNGIDLVASMDELSVSATSFSTAANKYDLNNIHVSGLDIELETYAGSNPKLLEERGDSVDFQDGGGGLPEIYIGELVLNQIAFRSKDQIGGSEMSLRLDEHRLSSLEFLPGDSAFHKNRLSTADIFTSGLQIEMVSVTEEGQTVEEGQEVPDFDIEWPDWEIQTGRIVFEDNVLHFLERGSQPTAGQLNPENLKFWLDLIDFDEIVLKDERLILRINDVKGSEQSGFELKKAGLDVTVDGTSAHLKEIDIRTSYSSLDSEIFLSFENISQLINRPEDILFNLNIRDLRIGPRDVVALQPDLTKDSILGPLLAYPMRLRMSAQGTLKELNIERLIANAGASSRLDLAGKLFNLDEPTELAYHLNHFNFSTTQRDIALLVPPDTSYVMPENVLIVGNASGTTDRIKADFDVTIPHGKLMVNGEIADLAGQFIYSTEIILENIDAAHYTDSLAPEIISGVVELSGQGYDPEALSAEFKGNFTAIRHRGISYSPFIIEGSWTEKTGEIQAEMNAELLSFRLEGAGSLDSTAYSFNAVLDLAHMDAFAFGLFEDSTNLETRLVADVSGNEGVLSSSVQIDRLMVVQSGEFYFLDSIEANFYYDPNSTFLDLTSPVANANLNVNTSPDKILSGLAAHIEIYRNPQMSDSIVIDGLEADFSLHIPETRFLREVLAPDIESMQTITALVRYRERTKSILAEIDAPYVKYAGIEVEGFSFNAESNRDSLTFEAGFENLVAGAMDVRRTRLNGLFRDSTLKTTLDIRSLEEVQIARLHLSFNWDSDTLQLHLEPHELIFNDEIWQVSEDNRIFYASNYLKIREFKLQRKDNLFMISSHPSGRYDFLRLDFDNLSLGGLLDLINPEEEIADAVLSGKIELDNIFEQPELLVDLRAQDLVAMDMPLGNLVAKVENNSPNEFELDVRVTDGELDMEAVGLLTTGGEMGPEYQGDLLLNKLNFALVEKFTDGAIRNSGGFIRGELSTKGTGADVNYSGFFVFDSVSFVTVETATTFFIPQERIDFSESEIVFSDFTIRDGNGNPTRLSGSMDITNPLNPGFNLNVNSRNFSFLESTREDNDLFFGKALADLNVEIGGNLNRPNVIAEVELKRGTEITMIIPETQIDIEDREGVVRIERRVDGKVVRDREEETNGDPLFTGVDIQAVIRLDPAVLFRIVIDERAGDQLEVAGSANLSFDMDAEGRMSLSGTYELSRGFYEMRMYDIVRRRFELQPGSRLIWSGDPMEADMQITAIYRVRTSALDLMADQLAGADQTTRTQYRQELPFDVNMNIGGELLRPDLTFSLDMPESARGALGGNVYSRIQQLNNTESELNTQVFSLLVLNRFLPQGFASEESGLFDAGAMARSSASSLLSGQLNALSDRYIRGVDMDFDLESFTDYQTGRPEDRTQLNVRMRRSLVGDRLTVEVGGQIDLEGSEVADRQSATDILGDVNIEYRLSENGNWRLRGFRRNQYEGVLEGQVIATGISLLFNRDFNSFAELFTRKKDREDD